MTILIALTAFVIGYMLGFVFHRRELEEMRQLLRERPFFHPISTQGLEDYMAPMIERQQRRLEYLHGKPDEHIEDGAIAHQDDDKD